MSNKLEMAFEFRLIEEGNGVFRPTITLCQIDDESSNGWVRFFGGWKRKFEISAYGYTLDKELGMAKEYNEFSLYGLEIKSEMTLCYVDELSSLFKKLAKGFREYLLENPKPETFGQFIFVVAKIMKIKTILFENSSYDRSIDNRRWIDYNLPDGTSRINYEIMHKLPHLNRPISLPMI